MEGVKAVLISYTCGRKFYGVYLYDVPQTANVRWKEKLGRKEGIEWLKSIGIDMEIPRRYITRKLDQIISELQNKGIVADHDDIMDIS